MQIVKEETWQRRDGCTACISGLQMMRIHFTAEDLARTRFLPEPAPLMELKLALVALHRRDTAPRFSRWRRAALTRFPESGRPLWELVAGFSGAVSTTAVCGDLDEALDTVRGLSRDQGRQEASRWFGAGGRVVPSWLRDVADGNRDAEQCLIRAFYSAYAAILRPWWPAIRAGHHTELARNGRLLARQGTIGMLTNLVPGARWHNACLEIDTPCEREIRLRGRGLALAPTVFWAGTPLLAGAPDQPALLVYPSHTPALLEVGLDHDPLAGVLGPTRAAVLRLLSRPTVTKDIARRLDISPASASEHTTALRAARLIISHRDGKAVLHHATPLGLDLINTNSQ
jgi:DNA-binding transcriptional ArsR family regulator